MSVFFSWFMREWIGAREKQVAWTVKLFSDNLLFRTLTHSPMNPENKRPKGPHIMHLSTICHLLTDWPGWPSFVFPIGPKNTNLVEDIEIFLSSFIAGHSGVSEEKSKMSQPIRSQDGHLIFPIGWKKHKL